MMKNHEGTTIDDELMMKKYEELTFQSPLMMKNHQDDAQGWHNHWWKTHTLAAWWKIHEQWAKNPRKILMSYDGSWIQKINQNHPPGQHFKWVVCLLDVGTIGIETPWNTHECWRPSTQKNTKTNHLRFMFHHPTYTYGISKNKPQIQLECVIQTTKQI